MSEDQIESNAPRIVTGKSARAAASMFNYGNIAAILIPIPIGLLWLGISMIVYAMNRHHPNEKVGHYTQQAAYRFYAITGLLVAAGIFIPRGGIEYYIVTWVLSALILIPWSILDLVRIRKDHWEDIEIPEEEAHS
jgi:hypothetical protein